MAARIEVMRKLKIGFIGVGNMGQAAHLRNYAALDECEVVALAEIRPELAAKVAARHGIPSVYPDAETLLAHETLDGLVASQPFQRHGILIPELLRAGLPVFIEKPLASSVEVAEKIAEADRAAGGKLMVGYHKRSDLATVRAKTEIDRLRISGELGKLRYLRVTMPPGDWIAGGWNELIEGENFPAPLVSDPAPPDLDEESFNEYVYFVNYYIHQVNLIRYLLGESYKVTYADPARLLLVGASDSGVTAVLEMAPYNTSLAWDETALATFERGYVKLSLPAPLVLHQPGRVEIFRDKQGDEAGTFTPHLPWEHAMKTQARNFLRFAADEAPPPCGAAEALADLHVALAWLKQVRSL